LRLRTWSALSGMVQRIAPPDAGDTPAQGQAGPFRLPERDMLWHGR
jgi:hypothetical protein